MDRKRITILLLMWLISIAGYSQKIIKGFVIDSASFAPLGYVNIKVKNSPRGTSTDTKGAFAISTLQNDSLVFSLVGYNTESFSISELDETVIIRMAIQVKTLDMITIIGKKEKVVRPVHITSEGGVPAYAPLTGGVNLGYFSKLEKEKRKLMQVRAEWQIVKNYVAVVCSPEVRVRICEEFSLTEDQYYSLLAKFNMTNKDARYDLTPEEWLTVLRKFCALNVAKK